MDYGIQDDDCFDELVQKGLIQDIVNLSAALGAKLEVLPTMNGWRMTVQNNGRTVQLERRSDHLELSLLELERKKQYPCDAENVVGAAIDLMKASARK